MVAAEIQPQRREFVGDYRNRLARLLHFPQPDIAKRRETWGKRADRKLFPHKLLKGQEGIDEAARLMQEENFAFIPLVTHWNQRDHEEAIKDLCLHNRFFCGVEYVAPVAYHQWKEAIAFIGRIMGVTTLPLVNPHTMKLQADYSKPSLLQKVATVFQYKAGNKLGFEMTKEAYDKKMKGRKLSKDERNEMSERYTAISGAVMKNGGGVILSPESERGDHLRTFKFRGFGPIETVVQAAKSQGVEKIVFLVIGLGEEGREIYEIEGILLGSTMTVEVSNAITLSYANGEVAKRNEELRQAGMKPNYTLDDYFHEVMKTVAPDGYVEEEAA